MSVNWRRIAERFSNAPEPEREVKMNGCLYSIYDRKADAYAPPMFFQNEEVMKRSLRMEFEQKPLTPVVAYPGDYDVWLLADFSTDTGDVSALKRHVCSCRVLVKDALDVPPLGGGEG